LGEIRRAFEENAADEEHFPSTIDPRILHVQTVLEEMRGRGRVLDLGCGKGRFARLVKDADPRSQVAAADLALAMLQAASPDLDRVVAGMLTLPFRDGAFDGAYATESLEHAVDIGQAVAELARVVRPGGRIVIIDKNAAHWGRLATPAWERWFHPGELLALLRRNCRDAEAAPISYWEDVAPDGLFYCWKATR
jgi:ubiquinone/menaquinone biosynthesis C-methylase UbiE